MKGAVIWEIELTAFSKVELTLAPKIRPKPMIQTPTRIEEQVPTRQTIRVRLMPPTITPLRVPTKRIERLDQV